MTTGRGKNPNCTLHIALTDQILFDLHIFPFYFSPSSLSISDGSTVGVMASLCPPQCVRAADGGGGQQYPTVPAANREEQGEWGLIWLS